MRYPEEETHWAWQAYKHGELLDEGLMPIPDEIADQATEIRWIKEKPEPSESES